MEKWVNLMKKLINKQNTWKMKKKSRERKRMLKIVILWESKFYPDTESDSSTASKS